MSSVALRLQTCHNHEGREAAARCPSCGFYYCRECITEHDERVLCATCVKKLSAPREKRRWNFAPLARTFAAAFGLLLAWYYFFFIGRFLVRVPTKFHEATLWKTSVENEMNKDDSP